MHQNKGEALRDLGAVKEVSYTYKCSLPTEAASRICPSSLPGQEKTANVHKRILWIKGTASCPWCLTLGQICHLVVLEACLVCAETALGEAA